jgi:hypothetical protein
MSIKITLGSESKSNAFVTFRTKFVIMMSPRRAAENQLVCCDTQRRLGSQRVLLVAAFAKKILQDRSTFFLQNTRCNFAPVIKGRHLQEVHHAPSGSGRWICAAENHAADSRVHDRACAHCARFFRHIKIAIHQTPIADGRFSLR